MKCLEVVGKYFHNWFPVIFTCKWNCYDLLGFCSCCKDEIPWLDCKIMAHKKLTKDGRNFFEADSTLSVMQVSWVLPTCLGICGRIHRENQTPNKCFSVTDNKDWSTASVILSAKYSVDQAPQNSIINIRCTHEVCKQTYSWGPVHFCHRPL